MHHQSVTKTFLIETFKVCNCFISKWDYLYKKWDSEDQIAKNA